MPLSSSRTNGGILIDKKYSVSLSNDRDVWAGKIFKAPKDEVTLLKLPCSDPRLLLTEHVGLLDLLRIV